MEIIFEGQFSKQDLKSAYTLHQRTSFPLTLIFILLGLISLLTIIIVVILAISTHGINTTLVFLTFIPIFSWVFYFILPTRAANQTIKNPSFANPIKGVVNYEGIHMHGATFDSLLRWELWTKHKKSKGLVLLYQGKNLFNLFVKHMFSEAEWIEFVKLVESKVPKNK